MPWRGSPEETATTLAFQGIVNGASDAQPTVFFDVGSLDFDWPEADLWWRQKLDGESRVVFRDVQATLCGLVTGADPLHRVQGTVGYAASSGPFGDGYSLAIALTVAGQKAALPVTDAILARHECLRALPMIMDLRTVPQLANRPSAWRWAIDNLLPHASKTVVFNLNRFRVSADPARIRNDPQSNATIASIDYAVQQHAFVLDLETHLPPGDGGGNDDVLVQEVLARLAPLFSAYGWSYEYSWTNLTSHAGGAVFCSFATPNLSFWARLTCDREGRRKARALPHNDRGMTLNRSKYYVTFETNEGDTPRILVSAMGSSWASTRRGSLPVAWAVDPILAEQFPALFDYYSSTATVNDSFIAGVSGGGYVFLNQLSQALCDLCATCWALATGVWPRCC